METKKARVIVVLGMHRSGTSAIARGLEVLGVNLGNNLHPADRDNPKGFWEDRDFLDINEELLAHLGYSYDRLGLLDGDMPETSAIKLLRLKAQILVRGKCEESNVWGFKDPRTARLLSFWQPVLEDADCHVSYVIATRNPISIVKSLGKYGFEPERALYLWLEHLVPSISKTKGAYRVVVDYDQLLENPEQQLLRVMHALQLDKPEPVALATYRNEFLEAGLRHTQFARHDVKSYPSTPSQVVIAYDWLAKLANDECAIDSIEVERAFDALARDLVVLSPTLDLMARQQQTADIIRQAKEIQRLEEFAQEKQGVVDQLVAEAQGKQRVAEHLSHIVATLNAQLDQVRAELQGTLNHYRALQQTRWFRLREVLLFHPLGLRKVLKLAIVLAGGLVPHRLRLALTSQVDRFIRAPSVPASKDEGAARAYQVKLPPAPPLDAPRVVHVIANFMTGGSSRLVVDLVESLGGSVRQFIVTSFNPNPPSYIGLEIYECRHPQSIEPFLQYFRRTRPDFVHVHYWGDCDESWYAMAIDAAELLGLPVIENINTPIKPYHSAAVHKYVYVSDYVRNVYGKPDLRHETVYPGSDFKLFTRGKEDCAPDDCVGMVYRLERDKLNEEAIQPFIRIVQLRPQTKILIVGGGSLLDSFRAAVRTAGVADRFEFTDYVNYDRLPALYRRMSLFLAPVWKESFGQVVPFAMSMKVPVVGYDVGAIGEIIGNRDLLVQPADIESLAQISVRLLDSPDRRRQIGEALEARAETLFSVETMSSQYARLYAEITQSSRKEPA